MNPNRTFTKWTAKPRKNNDFGEAVIAFVGLGIIALICIGLQIAMN